MTSARGSISFCPEIAAFKHIYAAVRIIAINAALITNSINVNADLRLDPLPVKLPIQDWKLKIEPSLEFEAWKLELGILITFPYWP